MAEDKYKKFDLASVPRPSIEELSVESVDAKFGLEKNGASDGNKNEPKAGSGSLSPFEIKIRAHFTTNVAKARQTYVDVERDYREQRAQLRTTLNPEFDVTSLRQLKGEAENDVAKKFPTMRDQLKQVNENLDTSKKLYRVFRVNNNLTDREAAYPEDMAKFFRPVFIVALLELFFGFAFFQEAGTKLAAIGYAGAVVIVNFVMAFVAGNRMRFKNHVSLSQRIQYLSISIATSSIFLVLMVFVAHFRMALGEAKMLVSTGEFGTVAAAANNVALGTLQNNVFGLDITAFLFVCLTYAFGILSFYKGYTCTDEYPGYMELDKALKKAEKRRDDFQQGFIQDVCNTLEGKIRKLENTKEEIQAKYGSFLSSIQEHEALLERVKAESEGIDKNFEACIGMYRGANKYVRTEEAPPYFENKAEIENPLLDCLGGISSRDREYEKELTEFRKKVGEAYNEVYAQLQQLQTEKTEEVNALLRGGNQ